MPSASTRSIVDSLPGSGRWAPATAAHASRQQTLEGAIDWSYQLLSEHERLLWARLSVFAGGFELDAAQAVCAGDGLDAEDIPELVGSLVEKSVLKRRQGDSADRFRLLEPLRQFGRERLREAGAETDAARATPGLDRRACRARSAPTMRARSSCFGESGPSAPTSGRAIDFCLDDPAEAERGVAICSDLWVYWPAQGPISDIRRVLAALLPSIPAATRARARARCRPSGCLASSRTTTRSPDRCSPRPRRSVARPAMRMSSRVRWRSSRRSRGSRADPVDAAALADESLNLARSMHLRGRDASCAMPAARIRLPRTGDLDGAIAIARRGRASQRGAG